MAQLSLNKQDLSKILFNTINIKNLIQYIVEMK